MASKKVKVVKVALRLVAFMAALCAATVMLFTHQTANFSDSSIRIEFRDLIPYRCFLCINFVACAYSIFVSFLSSKSLLWKAVIACDVALMVLMWSSCSAAMVVICLEMNGNSHAHWIPICSQVPSYCMRALGAISVCYIGALAYLLLHLVSLQEALNPLLIDYK